MSNKNLFFLALGIGLSTLGFWALAGINLPHTFSAGSPIRAAEVNANFAALNNALPGVAQTAASDSVAITDTTPAVDSVTINVPGPGYVRVSATAQLNVEYTGTSSAMFTLAVSNTADTIRPDQDKRISLPGGLPAWTYRYIVSSERVFPVDSAGPKTFYLIAEENSSVQGTISSRTLTATFLTGMGTVQSP
ncbi:hypothetical protein Mlute_01823 [Meiothermus luteus]|jgi:hypothetical protein|uniref:Uncharacterized protein n=1 Tax=Meiothermus luteus TaxID=2026184 RepID=A0A399ENN3_9DEIN|nr:hypothetical protein [Meiothermus luteus]RIH84659.1 hypothetical protein Mlute_01823 [Meiothermus luteus]RMH57699.1 MAG: hypothetical protein D6684_02730 [Deinococcota bacterium]